MKTHYWRLRGKLDVLKERFFTLPGCEREADKTPLATGPAGTTYGKRRPWRPITRQ